MIFSLLLHLTLSHADKRKTLTVVSSVSLNTQETRCDEAKKSSPRTAYRLCFTAKETNEGKRKLRQYMCVWVIKMNLFFR